MNISQQPHVVLVPFVALGHSIPFLDLARLLASHGLTVSYVTTTANVSRVQDSIPEAGSSNLDIRLEVLSPPVVEGLPEGRESADLIPRESVGALFQFAQRLQDPFNQWMEQQLEQQSAGGTAAPICIIHDLFMGWAQESAEMYNIDSFVFTACGAYALSLLHSLSGSILQEGLEKEGDCLVLRSNLPNPVRLHRHEISVDFFDPDLSNGRLRFLLGRLQSITKGCGMLMNTFHELEPAHIQHLKNLTSKPVWAVGPLLPPILFGGATKGSARGKTADISEKDLVRWLDSQTPRSVVYISFGSHTSLSEIQTHALARGLEASGQPFIWAIKVPPRIEYLSSDPADLAIRYLTEGFQERTKDRGLVIWGWAPQLVILSHPSAGAFVSHCGWNSTLEGISLGVPLIAWPMFGDQHFNAKLVSELGVGIRFCQHRDGIPNEERVKQVIALVLNEEKGQEMKKRAEEWKESAKKVVELGGSSREDLQDFVSDVYKLSASRVYR